MSGNIYEKLMVLLEENTSNMGSFTIYFNEHKTVYDSPEIYYSEDLAEPENHSLDLEKDIYWLCWYKDTPVGSYHIFGNSIEDLYLKVLEVL